MQGVDEELSDCKARLQRCHDISAELIAVAQRFPGFDSAAITPSYDALSQQLLSHNQVLSWSAFRADWS